MIWVLADFGQDEAKLFAAGRRLRELGHARLDAYSPYPLHGVEEAFGIKRSIVPLLALVAGVTGAVTGYAMQWWMNSIDWAINVGNRPPHSPPANIPITFELGVLFASLTIVIGLLALCGFPRLHHPVFEVEAFRTASVDALWLSVQVPAGEVAGVSRELEQLGAARVEAVPEVTR